MPKSLPWKAIRQSRVALARPAPLVRSERRLCLQLPEKGLGFRQPAINYDPGLAAWTCQFPSVFCFVTVRKRAPPDWFLEVPRVLCHSSVSLTIQLKFHSTQGRQHSLDREAQRVWPQRFQKDLQWGHVRSHQPNLEMFFTSQVRLTCVSHLTQCWLSSW